VKLQNIISQLSYDMIVYFMVTTKLNRNEGLTPEIPKECAVVLREVMQMCWKRDPQQRPSFEYFIALLEKAIPQSELASKL
jgi:hypothetical protein